MLMLFSYCFGQVWLLFLKGTNQILNFGGRPLFYSTHGTAMVWLWQAHGMAMASLWYDNPDVKVQYDMITWKSVLLEYILLGEEARFPDFEGK